MLKVASQDLPISCNLLYKNNEDIQFKLNLVAMKFNMKDSCIPDSFTEDHLEAYLKSLKRVMKGK